jgi:hypothetical protein
MLAGYRNPKRGHSNSGFAIVAQNADSLKEHVNPEAGE